MYPPPDDATRRQGNYIAFKEEIRKTAGRNIDSPRLQRAIENYRNRKEKESVCDFPRLSGIGGINPPHAAYFVAAGRFRGFYDI